MGRRLLKWRNLYCQCCLYPQNELAIPDRKSKCTIFIHSYCACEHFIVGAFICLTSTYLNLNFRFFFLMSRLITSWYLSQFFNSMFSIQYGQIEELCYVCDWRNDREPCRTDKDVLFRNTLSKQNPDLRTALAIFCLQTVSRLSHWWLWFTS